jgi:hypothetical protein
VQGTLTLGANTTLVFDFVDIQPLQLDNTTALVVAPQTITTIRIVLRQPLLLIVNQTSVPLLVPLIAFHEPLDADAFAQLAAQFLVQVDDSALFSVNDTRSPACRPYIVARTVLDNGRMSALLSVEVPDADECLATPPKSSSSPAGWSRLALVGVCLAGGCLLLGVPLAILVFYFAVYRTGHCYARDSDRDRDHVWSPARADSTHRTFSGRRNMVSLVTRASRNSSVVGGDEQAQETP